MVLEDKLALAGGGAEVQCRRRLGALLSGAPARVWDLRDRRPSGPRPEPVPGPGPWSVP